MNPFQVFPARSTAHGTDRVEGVGEDVELLLRLGLEANLRRDLSVSLFSEFSAIRKSLRPCYRGVLRINKFFHSFPGSGEDPV